MAGTKQEKRDGALISLPKSLSRLKHGFDSRRGHHSPCKSADSCQANSWAASPRNWHYVPLHDSFRCAFCDHQGATPLRVMANGLRRHADNRAYLHVAQAKLCEVAASVLA